MTLRYAVFQDSAGRTPNLHGYPDGICRSTLKDRAMLGRKTCMPRLKDLLCVTARSGIATINTRNIGHSMVVLGASCPLLDGKFLEPTTRFAIAPTAEHEVVAVVILDLISPAVKNHRIDSAYLIAITLEDGKAMVDLNRPFESGIGGCWGRIPWNHEVAALEIFSGSGALVSSKIYPILANRERSSRLGKLGGKSASDLCEVLVGKKPWSSLKTSWWKELLSDLWS